MAEHGREGIAAKGVPHAVVTATTFLPHTPSPPPSRPPLSLPLLLLLLMPHRPLLVVLPPPPLVAQYLVGVPDRREYPVLRRQRVPAVVVAPPGAPRTAPSIGMVRQRQAAVGQPDLLRRRVARDAEDRVRVRRIEVRSARRRRRG